MILPYREMVIEVAQQLHTISDKLIRRAALEQASLRPDRAEEWAVAIRGAEKMLVEYAADLNRQGRRRRSA